MMSFLSLRRALKDSFLTTTWAHNKHLHYLSPKAITHNNLTRTLRSCIIFFHLWTSTDSQTGSWYSEMGTGHPRCGTYITLYSWFGWKDRLWRRSIHHTCSLSPIKTEISSLNSDHKSTYCLQLPDTKSVYAVSPLDEFTCILVLQPPEVMWFLSGFRWAFKNRLLASRDKVPDIPPRSRPNKQELSHRL
jgi:hypothetical protein